VEFRKKKKKKRKKKRRRRRMLGLYERLRKGQKKRPTHTRGRRGKTQLLLLIISLSLFTALKM